MDYIKITKEPLDVSDIIGLASHETCGAISTFLGTTREDVLDGKKVICLEYEAYESMAVKEMERIAKEIRTRYDDVAHVVIYHRVGVVRVKEASVAIAVSSKHRRSALEAVEFAIEELKKNVPIFKKEIYDDDAVWKVNKESCFQRLKKMRNVCSFSALGGYKNVSSNLLQINAQENELGRRINSFLERKRQELNEINIADYAHAESVTNSDAEIAHNSCARTDCYMLKRSDTKQHLRVRRVHNVHGPQMQSSYTRMLNKLMSEKINIKREESSPSGCPICNNPSPGIWERLTNVENYFKITPDDPKNLFSRLKAIEDHLLFLESISPEYKHFVSLPHRTQSGKGTTIYKYSEASTQPKNNYTVGDIDQLLIKYRK